jgi:hypothetical protein
VFEVLNEIIQYEPTELFSAELLGRLATLGIEKGKPFDPDARMQRIFEQAAKQGVAMSRAIVSPVRCRDTCPDACHDISKTGVDSRGLEGTTS